MSGWLGFVDGAGHFSLDNPKSFRQVLAEKHKGHEVLVTVKRKQKAQGSQSMRYYRGVVIPDIAAACGYSDPDDFQSVHDSLAWKFLRLPDDPLFNTPRRQSTAKDAMPQPQMTAYIDQCIVWAESSIPGCKVRRPDEVDLDDLSGGWHPSSDEAA